MVPAPGYLEQQPAAGASQVRAAGPHRSRAQEVEGGHDEKHRADERHGLQARVEAAECGEYRRLADVAKACADKSAIVLATALGGEHLAPDTAPTWKVVFVE